MRILVIGSEGNIGEPFVRHLRTCGHEVHAADIRPGWRPDFLTADITQPLDLLPAFDWGPEVVYLAAALVSRVTCEQAPTLAVATNVGGTATIATLCRRVGARLVFLSTSEVYGPTDGLMNERSAPRPNNRYGLTKWLGEQLVRYEVDLGLDALIVRPFMVYSEDEDLGDHRSAMIRFASDLAAERPITVHRGTARSWLHISDAVRALERCAHVPGLDVVNIGHPDVIATEQLAEGIRARLGAAAKLVHLIDQPDGMTPVKRPALDRQREHLGIEPLIGIDEGIERVCARFRTRSAVAA